MARLTSSTARLTSSTAGLLLSRNEIIYIVAGCVIYTIISIGTAYLIVSKEKWLRVKSDRCLAVLYIAGCSLLGLLWPLNLLLLAIYGLWYFYYEKYTEERQSCCFTNCDDIEAS